MAGVFINGSTGDFSSLSIEERNQLAAAWGSQRDSNFKVVNHIGHTNLKEAITMAEFSSEFVDAIATLSPYYFKPSSLEKLVFYCAEIAKSAPNLPFYYYHIPDLTGAHFDMLSFTTLAKEQIPSFAGLKFTQNNFIHYAKVQEHYRATSDVALFGVDECFLSSLPLGAKGWVGSTYNHLAPLYYKIKECFEEGNHEEAAMLQQKAIAFVDLVASYGGFNGGGKSVMKILGIDCGASRYPHTTLTDKQLKELTTQIDGLGLSPYLSV